jgi:hypothetical protein
MDALFNKNGKTIAWLEKDKIYNLKGKNLLVINKNNVYNINGKHKGKFEGGYIWDKKGNAIAFIMEAKGGPLLPIPEIPPIPSIHEIPPIPSIAEIPPISPLKSLNWSKQNWDEFLLG